ncbi:Trm112 family protein [Geomesophilobacter sediminis]|uniref:Trm112 family protein n=1 Tax=Geomesophilobacter sediminis TaxID=2798584 RepID=A0A8J7J4R9_9BACT|nr:Trm112 family protein [Geomesophilobacter sediminis]MBJ6725953.1 Trm112 family protein [Geomesophilobacter sediminis]
MALSQALLEVLACPGCRGKLLDREDHLVCPACAVRYRVEDGIPVLLVEQAEPV